MLEIEKFKVIRKQKVSGKPNLGFEDISWYDFLYDLQAEDEEEIHKYALTFLRGEWVFLNGSTYFLPPIINGF